MSVFMSVLPLIARGHRRIEQRVGVENRDQLETASHYTHQHSIGGVGARCRSNFVRLDDDRVVQRVDRQPHAAFHVAPRTLPIHAVAREQQRRVIHRSLPIHAPCAEF